MMRIVIDLQGAQTESRFRGIGYYSLSLAKAIARNRKNHEVIIALSDLFPETIEEIRTAFENILPQENICVWSAPSSKTGSTIENEQRRQIAELIREVFFASFQPDIIHVCSLFEGFIDDAVTSVGSFDKITPVSVSLYDLIPLLNREHYLKTNPKYEEFYLRKVKHLKQADLLLSISEYTKQEGSETLKDMASKIHNISAAIADHFKPLEIEEEDQKKIRKAFGLTGSYVLYAGAGDERKNLPRLIRAFARLPETLRDSHQLVFAGKMSAGEVAALQEEADAAGLKSGDLIFTGYVSDEELVQLYNLCKLFVFPSWHEGFGLPALEAMTCGAPVIAANSTSLTEVIGNTKALFDPFSIDDLYDKITVALSDQQFCQELIDYGLKRIQHFSWDKTAKRAIKLFEDVYNQKNHIPNLAICRDHLVSAISTLVDLTSLKEEDILGISLSIDKNIKTTLQFKAHNQTLKWRIEGPFDSSYSLALLNRETATALDKLGCDVALHSTEGPGDYDPNPEFLDANNRISALFEKSKVKEVCAFDIASRNLYPPRVNDFSNSVNFIHHYAWEETGFPNEWAFAFNFYLHGMTCLSDHVCKIMIDNGVMIPLDVSGCGVDHWENITASSDYEININSFVFLHVSSCFPRKGADILIQSYLSEFSSNDDVSLVIKTFPNPHNNVRQIVNDLCKSKLNPPHILIIEKDLSNEDLKALYEKCDVLVAPSLAEGFGLPLAEAMLSGLPVITTAWSGQLDFCSEENSWLVDYDFERAHSHFGLFLSAWAKPKSVELAKAMYEAYSASPEELVEKANKGRAFLLGKYKWADVAERYKNFVHEIILDENSKLPNIAWISTWKTKCGIATYSEHLIDSIPTNNIIVFSPNAPDPKTKSAGKYIKNWIIGKEQNKLFNITNNIRNKDINTIVIQFNYGFFNHQELSEFIKDNIQQGCIIIVMMHSTTDPEEKEPKSNFQLKYLAPILKQCHRLLVHSVADLNRLKQIGLVENVALFPHGVLNKCHKVHRRRLSRTPLIASYGFCLQHKGLEELVEAIALMKQNEHRVRLRLVNSEYPIDESRQLIGTIKDKIKQLDLEDTVEFNHNFLDDEDSLALLSEADLLVFAYQETGESSSAAARYGMSTGVPVAVTPLPIFEDLGDAAFSLPGCNTTSISKGITEILHELSINSEKVRKLEEKANKWRNEFDYDVVGQRLYGICTGLLRQRNKS